MYSFNVFFLEMASSFMDKYMYKHISLYVALRKMDDSIELAKLRGLVTVER